MIYSILISGEDMALTNWVEYQNTYRQAPNTVPQTFFSLFTPLQRFFDSVIKKYKTEKESTHQVNYRQFPNFDYAVDTRLEVGMCYSIDFDDELHCRVYPSTSPFTLFS